MDAPGRFNVTQQWDMVQIEGEKEPPTPQQRAEGVEEVQHFSVLSEERLQQILAGALDECSNLQVLFLIGILTRGSSPHPLLLPAFTTSDVAFTTALIRLSVFSLVPIQESMYVQGYHRNKTSYCAAPDQHPHSCSISRSRSL